MSDPLDRRLHNIKPCDGRFIRSISLLCQDCGYDEDTHLLMAAKAEVERLRADSDILRHSNIIEIAVRNESGSVSDYMNHWEKRAEHAEAEVAQLRQQHMSVMEAAEFHMLPGDFSRFKDEIDQKLAGPSPVPETTEVKGQ